VTHINPDLDAVASVWILKRFDKQHFGKAELKFVSAGDRISPVEMRDKGLEADDVVHVDTGLGEFDHHSEKLANKRICAASLVRDHMVKVHSELAEDVALLRMVDHVVEIDHFGEIFCPEPNADRYMFGLVEILHHLKTIGKSDEEVVEYAMVALESIYSSFRARVAGEREMKEGVEFKTRWGKGLGVKTPNDEVIKLAQKSGYKVVVRKDPQLGNVRIKAVPGEAIDLTDIYEKISQRDSQASWYFHPAKTMLLNGSRKQQNQVASKLSLKEVIEIIRS